MRNRGRSGQSVVRVSGMFAAITLALAACGEPDVSIEIPDRGEEQRVLDVAGVLDVEDVESALDEAAAESGLDVVGLAFEDDAVNAGEADRGGRELLAEWGADVVLVAVAAPGDFAAIDDNRERFFGVYASDRFEIPRSLREEVIDNHMTPFAAENQWTEGFVSSAAALSDLVEGAETP